LFCDHTLTFPNHATPCYAFDIVGKPLNGTMYSDCFTNFRSMEQRLLNFKWFFPLKIHFKIINLNFSVNQCFFIVLSLLFVLSHSKLGLVTFEFTFEPIKFFHY
jgi:hypothetical protein